MSREARNHPGKSDIADRRVTFSEVNLGFTREQALAEADRCLECRNPKCSQGCPVEVSIPSFIRELKADNASAALEIIKKRNSLPAICGRVCPQETQCEGLCILGNKGEPVAIGLLERYAADHGIVESVNSVAPGKEDRVKVAVIGSGPAGLTCAADLALLGYGVTLFESLHAPGGVLTYGIPEFRLPKAIVGREVDYIRSLGVDIECNVSVGQTVTLDELRDEGYKAFFISSGAGLPYFMNIPGESLGSVYSANEFLTRVNLMKAYKFPEYDTPVRVGSSVCVVGGGNVAMDAARTALRMGAETVRVIYRRTMSEMPARKEEAENAVEEGIIFETLSNPVRILGDSEGRVTGIECVRMELGEPDASGRPGTSPIKGSNYVIPADTVVIAIGQGPNPILIRNSGSLKLNRKGYIEADDMTGATNIPGVYAGGDIVTGAATVIAAMGSGKVAAKAIDAYLKS